MSSPPHTILIVEDHAELRNLFTRILQVDGYRVIQAGNGITALRILDFNTPDLIVLDLFLPDVSGFSVRQEIAARAELQHVPIVVVTGAFPEQVRTLHVACVLSKPVSPEELLAAVRRCLNGGAPAARE